MRKYVLKAVDANLFVAENWDLKRAGGVPFHTEVEEAYFFESAEKAFSVMVEVPVLTGVYAVDSDDFDDPESLTLGWEQVP